MELIMKNILWLLPEIFLMTGIVIILGYGVIYSKIGGRIAGLRSITWISIALLASTGILAIGEKGKIGNDIISVSNGIMEITGLNLSVKVIVIMAGIAILLLSLKYQGIPEYELPVVILISILGIMVLISSGDLLMLYLGIELLSLSLYILAGIKRGGQYSTEAGLKYFVLGALSSGIYLMGCALIYTTTGEIRFEGLNKLLWYGEVESIVLIGACFIMIALLFKLAAAPFHMWAPDVYEGAPTIITAFFAIVPKIAILSILIKLLSGPFIGILAELQPLILISVILSLIVGSIGALNQTKIKRLLAYSAIGHMGFMLLGIVPLSLISLQATLIYIILYIIMSINSFTFVLSYYKGSSNYITQLSGLSRTQPVLAITFALCLLSIAGIPPLAGFLSKYLILLSAVDNGLYLISLIAVITSVISAFYYLRVIKWMFFKDTGDFYRKDIGDAILPSIQIPLVYALILGSSLYLILTLLIFPKALMIITFESISSLLI